MLDVFFLLFKNKIKSLIYTALKSVEPQCKNQSQGSFVLYDQFEFKGNFFHLDTDAGR